MSFAVRVNGVEVWTTEAQVDEVSLQSANGEAGRVGCSIDTSVVDIIVREIAPGGPLRLDHLEALQRQQLAGLREGQVAGGLVTDRYNPPDTMRGTQGDHTYTATEENVDINTPLEPLPAPVVVPAPTADVAGDQTSGTDAGGPTTQTGQDTGTTTTPFSIPAGDTSNTPPAGDTPPAPGDTPPAP